MNRSEAIATIKEIFTLDHIGIKYTLTDEQIAAIQMALAALEHPERVRCKCCQKFIGDGNDRWGWCEFHNREATGRDAPCGYYEADRRSP